MSKYKYKHLFTTNTPEEWAELIKYLSLDKMGPGEFATKAVRDYIKKCKKHYDKMRLPECL